MGALVKLMIVAAAPFGLLAVSGAQAETSTQAAARNAENANILAKFYPPRALAAREQGQVGFTVKLDAQGHPAECQVTRSSGYPLLDQETCAIITLHAVFPRVNKSVETASQLSTHQGAINWQLPSGGVSATKPSKPVKTASASEKIICKRTLKGDTHIGYERVCMTATDWERAFDETRVLWREIRGKGTTGGS